MVATNSAVNRIGVEGGAKSKIGEARFLLRGLAISPPGFSRFCKRVFPPDFFEKKIKLVGTLGGHPLIQFLAEGFFGWIIAGRIVVLPSGSS